MVHVEEKMDVKYCFLLRVYKNIQLYCMKLYIEEFVLFDGFDSLRPINNLSVM